MAEICDKTLIAGDLDESGPSASEIHRARADAATETQTVNKIIWAQTGRVTEPGRYMFKFGWLTVSAKDLAIWEQFPNAAFTLLRKAPAAEAEDEYRLGTFELRENISLSKK
jgi:hypothetical protein